MHLREGKLRRATCPLRELPWCLRGLSPDEGRLILVVMKNGSRRVFHADNLSVLENDLQASDPMVYWRPMWVDQEREPPPEGSLLVQVQKRDELLNLLEQSHDCVHLLSVRSIEDSLSEIPGDVSKRLLDLEHLQSRVKKLEEALKKYGDPASWTPLPGTPRLMVWVGHGLGSEGLENPAKVAEEALKEGE